MYSQITRSILVLFCFFMTCSAEAKVLAKVGSQVITLEEFNQKYEDNKKYVTTHELPSKANVLKDMINRLLAIQEAKKRKLDKDSKVIEQMETTLYHALISKDLADDFQKIKVSDEEAKAYYEKNPEYRTSHIFIRVSPTANKNEEAQAKQKIDEAYEILKKGKKSFAEIANEKSDGIVNKNGGDIGFRRKDQLDPIYYNAVRELKKMGAIAGPLRSQYGWHIIKLTGQRKWNEADPIHYKRMVFDEKRMDIFNAYFSKLRKSTPVSIDRSLLK